MTELEQILSQTPKYSTPELFVLLMILSSLLSNKQETQLLLPEKTDHENDIIRTSPVLATTENVPQKSLEEKKPAREYRPIPDNGDRLIMVLNFLLREVLPIESKEAQKQLLIYYFKAILSESIFSPFTSLAYTITTNNAGEIKIHDDIYQIRPDVSAVCKSAITHAQTEAERQRFTLESEQFQGLIDALHTLLTSGLSPHAIIEQLGTTKETAPQKTEANFFSSFGWIYTESLITIEAAQKLNLTTIQTPCYAGKKIVYLMPQSEVHAGDMSVVVVAQPIYIPSIKQFVLLHDQSFFSTSWQSHLKTLQKLGVVIDPELIEIAKKQRLSIDEKRQLEKFIMSQIVTLDSQQTTPAKNVLSQLLGKQSLVNKAKEWWKKTRIKRMEKSLDVYAEVTLAVLKEEELGGHIAPKKIRSLTQFIKRIILAGVITESQISKEQIPRLITLYREHGHKTERAFAETAAFGFNFGAAIRAIDTSLLECVSIGTIQGFGLNRVLSQLSNNPLAVSRDNLASVIGADRALKWRENQTCIQCGNKNTWVGECGLCLACETAPSLKREFKPKQPSAHRGSNTDIKKESPYLPQTISVGGLIANLI